VPRDLLVERTLETAQEEARLSAVIRSRRWRSILALLAASALVLAACGDDDEETNGGEESPAATAGAGGLSLTMEDDSFDPDELRVAAGSDVTIALTNDGNAIHNVRIAGADGEFESDDDAVSDPDRIEGGGLGTLVWTAPAQAGDYQFRCDFHPSQMTGTIKVD
jgi:plastocyanin